MKPQLNIPDSWRKHQHFMQIALEQARLAYLLDEVPVGAVVVHEGVIIGRGHNMVETLKDPTAHAEMIAISAACTTQSDKFLTECSLYVTLEPCVMCSGAVVWARLKRMYVGTLDPKAGGSGSVFNISSNKKMNHQVEIVHNILEEECSEILRKFFIRKR